MMDGMDMIGMWDSLLHLEPVIQRASDATQAVTANSDHPGQSP